MDWLTKTFNFYINSSIHVALAVTALTYVTYLEYKLEPSSIVLGFNFFATITAYNFVKYFGLAKFHHRSLAQWLKIIQIFSALCFLALLYFSLKLPVNVLIFYAGLGVVTFLYAIPFIPKRFLFDSEKNLRSISGIKIYVIALVWVAATVIAPTLERQILFSTDIVLKSIQIFLIVLAWMIPFEIRDLQYDSIKLSTIPQIIGTRASRFLGILMVIVFVLLEYFKLTENHQSRSTIIVAVISICFILGARKNQNRYYSGFWVEAIPIFWLLLLFAV